MACAIDERVKVAAMAGDGEAMLAIGGLGRRRLMVEDGVDKVNELLAGLIGDRFEEE